MIKPVEPYIREFIDAGSDIITLHPEATPNLSASIQKIKSLGKKAGVSLNPDTSTDTIEKVLSEIIALNTLVRLSKLQIISNLNKSPSELDKTRENLRNQILNPEQLGNRSLMQYWINEALKK